MNYLGFIKKCGITHNEMVKLQNTLNRIKRRITDQEKYIATKLTGNDIDTNIGLFIYGVF